MEVNVLLDTNVLVYHVAGDPAATKFIDETIASTALVNNLRLVTTNIRDFRGIQELDVTDPLR